MAAQEFFLSNIVISGINPANPNPKSYFWYNITPHLNTCTSSKSFNWELLLVSSIARCSTWYTLPSLHEKCSYSKLFWSVFTRIRKEYGEILHISPYSVRIRENTDQNNSKYGHILRSALLSKSFLQLFNFGCGTKTMWRNFITFSWNFFTHVFKLPLVLIVAMLDIAWCLSENRSGRTLITLVQFHYICTSCTTRERTLCLLLSGSTNTGLSFHKRVSEKCFHLCFLKVPPENYFSSYYSP